jgi:hypothetical protein
LHYPTTPTQSANGGYLRRPGINTAAKSMTTTPSGRKIEVAQTGLTEGRADRVLGFWADQSGFEGPAARARLDEVLCVLLEEDGGIAGVNSVYEDAVPLIGNRRFFVYRSLLVPDAAADWEALLIAAFTELDRRYDPNGPGPGGICVPVSDPAQVALHPEALWPQSMMTYAGRLPDGTQVRVRYFMEGKI